MSARVNLFNKLPPPFLPLPKVAERFLVSPEALAVDHDSWSRVLSCAVDMHGALKPHVARHNAKSGYNTAFMATAVHFLRLLKLLK